MNNASDDIDEQQPRLYSGMILIGFVGLIVSSIVVFFNTGHPPLTLVCVILGGVLTLAFVYKYLKKCFTHPPNQYSQSGRVWNATHIYTPAMIVIASLLIAFTLVVVGIMYHFHYTIHHLFDVLEARYTIGLVFVLFLLLLVFVGSFGQCSYHRRHVMALVQELVPA
jgi:hypothetical protein